MLTLALLAGLLMLLAVVGDKVTLAPPPAPGSSTSGSLAPIPTASREAMNNPAPGAALSPDTAATPSNPGVPGPADPFKAFLEAQGGAPSSTPVAPTEQQDPAAINNPFAEAIRKQQTVHTVSPFAAIRPAP